MLLISDRTEIYTHRSWQEILPIINQLKFKSSKGFDRQCCKTDRKRTFPQFYKMIFTYCFIKYDYFNKYKN